MSNKEKSGWHRGPIRRAIKIRLVRLMRWARFVGKIEKEYPIERTFRQEI